MYIHQINLLLLKKAICYILVVLLCTSCYSNDNTDNENIDSVDIDTAIKKINTIKELRNPKDFLVMGDTTAFVIDRDLNGLHRYNLAQNELSEGTGIGQGPGELMRESLGFLAPYGDEHIWLHDQRAGRTIIYTNNLDPIEHIDIVGSLRALPFADSLVASIPTRGSRLVEVLRISDRIGANDSEEVLWKYSSNNKEIFKPILENWVLKYGPAAPCGEGVIVGFDFASYLLFIRKDGVQVLHAPQEVPFPHVDVGKGRVKLPSWFDPRATLSLSCDRTRIYSLFSGKSVSRDTVRKLQFAGELTRSTRANLSAEVERSHAVHVYDKSTGKFIHKLKLPVKAYSISIDENKFYILNKNMNIEVFSRKKY